MRYIARVLAAAGVLAASIGACSSDETASTGSPSTEATSSSSGSTSTASSTGEGGSGGSGQGAGGEGGKGPTLVNGCSFDTAEDHLADADVPIAFGGLPPSGVGLHYDPPCIKISAGSTVTFNGEFMSHPLTPGELQGAMGATVIDDPGSPITATSTGTTATFTFADPGDHPYYCAFHGPVEHMYGVVYVR